jgi:hypothetical protein
MINNNNLSYPSLTALLIFHHEWVEVKRIINEFHKFYPDSEVILSRDTLKPMLPEFLKSSNIKIMNTYECMQPLIELNWNLENASDLKLSKRYSIVESQLARLNEAANLANTEFLLALESDAHIRSKIPIYVDSDVESLEVNKYNSDLLDYVERISGKPFPLKGYGFVVGTFSKKSAQNAFTWFKSNTKYIEDLLNIDSNLVYLDALFPLMAHLSGSIISNNNLTIECKRDRFWRLKPQPLVHQYKMRKMTHRDYAGLFKRI